MRYNLLMNKSNHMQYGLIHDAILRTIVWLLNLPHLLNIVSGIDIIAALSALPVVVRREGLASVPFPERNFPWENTIVSLSGIDSDVEANLEVMRQVDHAWDDRDFAALDRLNAPDGKWTDIVTGHQKTRRIEFLKQGRWSMV